MLSLIWEPYLNVFTAPKCIGGALYEKKAAGIYLMLQLIEMLGACRGSTLLWLVKFFQKPQAG